MGKKDSKQNIREKMRYNFVRMVPHLLNSVVTDFDYMEEFKYFTLSAIEAEKKSIVKRFDKETDGMTEEQIRDYMDWNAEDYLIVDNVFQKISLNSFIIILYSYIESGLNTICWAKISDTRMEQKKNNLRAQDEGREPEFRHPLEVTFSDFDGKGIKRGKKYLEKVFGVSFDSVKEEWDEINALAKIRNAIVHDNSIAREKIEKDGKIKQHVRHGRIEITDHSENSYGRIVIKPEYLDVILPIAKDFFKKLKIGGR